jgi:spore coat polysaccharide biosynthesis protein SpsF (cytidylyltransferase family)
MIQTKKLDECGIIIQARMSSTRFPKKMMAYFAGIPLISYVYGRCNHSTMCRVIVATSNDPSDDELYSYCIKEGIRIVRGDLHNVLQRYINTAKSEKIEKVCRVCGDTPFVDVQLIDSLFEMLIENELDYVAPSRETCASGFYSEVFTLAALKRVSEMTKSSEDIEHVTQYILNNQSEFNMRLIDAELNPDFVRKVTFTVDYPHDLELVHKIASRLPGFSFTSQDVLNTIRNFTE